MRIAFGVIFVSGVCAGYALARTLGDHRDMGAEELYLATEATNGVQGLFKLEEILINNVVESSTQTIRKQEAYVILTSNGQRRKRHLQYTLCHFKICNMGRKRNTKYRSRAIHEEHS